MEHPRSLLTVSQALRRVFLQSRNLSPWSQRLSPIPRRTYNRVSAGAAPSASSLQPIKAAPLIDENIRSYEVLVVNNQNKLLPAQPLHQVLQSFDRATHFLSQVSPPQKTGLPICKILSKQDERERAQNRAKASRLAQRLPKQIELNWAIDAHDLSHRLDQLERFLSKGYKVEIIMARKRRGRRATMEEAQSIIDSVKERIQEVEGASEYKPMEGAVLGEATLYVQGKTKKEVQVNPTKSNS